ncbi:MAG: GNAT family N-acetyltransferase [Anaerolineae bacterium]|jgi:diamine N-acetyltransferase|nr:GNAT family N-acetyltransferase [Anaerolineae bacterium]
MSTTPVLSLREINMANFHKCIHLSVAEDQRGFVASNMYSLAEAKADDVSNPLAIYADETMVGFTMYWFDAEHNKGYIDRLMVDQRYQGQGYGRFAMTEVVRRLKGNPGCQRIQISFHPDNQTAEGLYYSLGFRRNGEMVEGEVVMLLELAG